MNIVDFGILDKWIYVLDFYEGLIIFEYKSDAINWSKIYNKKDLDSKSRYFGVTLNLYGSSLQIVIKYKYSISFIIIIFKQLLAEKSQIREFLVTNLEDKPQYVKSFKLNYANSGGVELQSSPDYVVIKQGKVVTVYDRNNENEKLVKAEKDNVEKMYLWYSDNMYAFTRKGVINVLLEYPTLNINYLKAKEGEDVFEEKLTIRATSKDFFDEEPAEIDIISVSIKN